MAEQACQIVAGSTAQDYDEDIPNKAGHALQAVATTPT